MSFGFSIGDIVLLTQIASKAIESTREACGERDALTREVRSLHVVLQRLAAEIEKPESLLRRCDDSRADELNTIVKGCKRTLRHLESRLKKSGALEKNGKKTGKKTWQQFRFGNKEMPALDKLRQRLATHTQHIQLFMNLLVYESQGNIEQLIEMQGAGLINIRKVLNQLVAAEMAGQREGSELTTRTDDDKSIWKDLRRALINDGISSKKIDQHKDDITSYIKGLGESGILDEEPEDVDNVWNVSPHCHVQYWLERRYKLRLRVNADFLNYRLEACQRLILRSWSMLMKGSAVNRIMCLRAIRVLKLRV